MDRSRVLDQDEVETFLAELADYQPAFPDSLVQYYLTRAGFVTDDIRIQRLVAVAAQKFIADVANDAIANSRLRAAAAPAPHGSRAKTSRDPKITLTLDDLELALRDYGVNLKKPPYFADTLTAGVPENHASSHQQSNQNITQNAPPHVQNVANAAQQQGQALDQPGEQKQISSQAKQQSQNIPKQQPQQPQQQSRQQQQGINPKVQGGPAVRPQAQQSSSANIPTVPSSVPPKVSSAAQGRASSSAPQQAPTKNSSLPSSDVPSTPSGT